PMTNDFFCSTQELLPRSACLGGQAAFPFPADLVQTVGAQLELIAQTAQHRGFLPIGLVGKRAGDVVRTFALLTIVNEMVLDQSRAQALERLGVDAGPEEGVIADVAVGFAARSAFG